MSYQKQNFKDGLCLCGHHLNHIEDGICDLEKKVGDGTPGKSAYQYAVDGGFEGTEEDFANLLASGTGGAEEVYIGEEEPTDENIKIWIDPNDDEKFPLSAFENDMGFVTAEDVPEAPQADWAQNDETAADYVKNRTHYEEWTEFFPETVAEYAEDMECALYEGETSKSLEIGKQYKFTVNGVENILTAVSEDGTPAILTDDGAMFGTIDYGDGTFYAVAIFPTTETTIFKVEELNIITIPDKFLPSSAQSYNFVLTEEEWASKENNLITITDRTCDDFIPLLWNGARLQITRKRNQEDSNAFVSIECYYPKGWFYCKNTLDDNYSLAIDVNNEITIVIGGTWTPPTEE